METSNREEQLELLKRVWADYGIPLTVSLAIAIIAVLSWQSWQRHELRQAAAASILYDQLVMQSQEMALDTGFPEKMAEQLIQRYPRTPYATMAALTLAKNATLQKDWSKAAEQLRWASSHGKDKRLRTIAKLRLARVLLQSKQYEEAINVAAAIKENNFQALALEIKGDVMQQQGQAAQAHDFYLRAQSFPKLDKSLRARLEMKLHNA